MMLSTGAYVCVYTKKILDTWLEGYFKVLHLKVYCNTYYMLLVSNQDYLVEETRRN